MRPGAGLRGGSVPWPPGDRPVQVRLPRLGAAARRHPAGQADAFAALLDALGIARTDVAAFSAEAVPQRGPAPAPPGMRLLQPVALVAAGNSFGPPAAAGLPPAGVKPSSAKP